MFEDAEEDISHETAGNAQEDEQRSTVEPLYEEPANDGRQGKSNSIQRGCTEVGPSQVVGGQAVDEHVDAGEQNGLADAHE